MAEVGDVNFCLKIQNKGDKIWNFHKKFLSLYRKSSVNSGRKGACPLRALFRDFVAPCFLNSC